MKECCLKNYEFERPHGPVAWKKGFLWDCRDCGTWYIFDGEQWKEKENQ